VNIPQAVRGSLGGSMDGDTATIDSDLAEQLVGGLQDGVATECRSLDGRGGCHAF